MKYTAAGIAADKMKRALNSYVACGAILLLSGPCGSVTRGQEPREGPIEPQPGIAIQKGPPPATIKLQSILVNTPVTVRDLRGEMVHDLDVKDFHVTDNGVEQKITHFDLGNEPLSIVIVVETSSRVTAILPELRRTGTLLTQAVMGPGGEAAIVSFHDSVARLQEFTTNADVIETKMARLKEGTDGVRLYDAMKLGVEMLSGRPAATPAKPGRRRVMLILAEAADKGSDARLGEVLRQAQLENVTIYSVGISSTRAALAKKQEYKRPTQPGPEGTFGLPPAPGTVQTPVSEDNRYTGIDLLGLAVWAVTHAKDQVTENSLQIATTATGGAHLATWKDQSIEKAIDEVGGELHSQYTLSYTPSDSNAAGYHEIKVDVDRKDLKVRSRPGYYLAGPTGQ
jgi:VWFA-related protein